MLVGMALYRPKWDGSELLKGQLFFGGEGCIADAPKRTALGITHVVTCCSVYEESWPPDEKAVTAGTWHVIRVADAADSDLLCHLNVRCATRPSYLCV